MHRRKVGATKKYGDAKMPGRKTAWTEKCPDEQMRDENIPLRKKCGTKHRATDEEMRTKKCGRKNADEKMPDEKRSWNRLVLLLLVLFVCWGEGKGL